jgi:DNA-binding CsgD family transcriptional regulator
MKCTKCTTKISPDDSYTHAGQTLCEDCYLEAVATPKTCDPWAVYSAKNTRSQDIGLTEEQQNILDLIKSRGPLTLEQICSHLGISEGDFRSNFATLRHMELAKGSRIEDRICYTLFDHKPI